jgi:hypothetical protein
MIGVEKLASKSICEQILQRSPFCPLLNSLLPGMDGDGSIMAIISRSSVLELSQSRRCPPDHVQSLERALDHKLYEATLTPSHIRILRI